MQKYMGETFLDKIYKDMHLTEIVMHSSNKSDNKYEKIRKYLNRLEDISNKSIEHKRIDLLKMFYYKLCSTL